MNQVFPEICSAPLGHAPPGSIAVIPRAEGSLLALVTDESKRKDLRSIVLLNLTFPNQPSVALHDNWGAGDVCLYYKTPLRFELNGDEKNIDVTGNWWRTVGLIVSANGEYLIRAAVSHSGFRYINVQTGSVVSNELPRFYAAFGSWSIWLRDPLHKRDAMIFEFKMASA